MRKENVAGRLWSGVPSMKASAAMVSKRMDVSATAKEVKKRAQYVEKPGRHVLTCDRLI
jgi:hypothetical protein